MQRSALFLILSLISLNVIAENSPLGYWKTIDDVTGKTQSIIKIFAAENNTLSGALVKTFPEPNEAPLTNCSACKGPRHNKPILGMTILTDLKPGKDNQWTEGNILDPTTGNIYHCSVKPLENGQKLAVRGYIGIPLFGRTQTWIAAEKPV
jgi:uncharacterized protein (DUF2147 family)